MQTRSASQLFCTCRATRQRLNTTNWSKGYATMADFRQLAKNNPLKPRPVAIPQLDPFTEIGTHNQKPTHQKTRKIIKQPAAATQKHTKPPTSPLLPTND